MLLRGGVGLMRKGIIPIALGTAVTLTGVSMLNRRHTDNRVDNPYAWGLAGFGLAHIVLGAIDTVRDNRHNEDDFF
ncbi:hypothetical protein HMPREF0083_01411 [Aneurinibacillus aneurinilyticus ATCC 12856]|jgi:predicted cobalt transporter CbtA|uniref:Asparagine synthase n=2 Tax=Aneurinibacillus aneurinilyticus TaxID=1391 RepID=U1X6A4_ANEAE|nr:hypothetical protein HMPREF0083_01411 [Aneurinibacillus aneurinilyticus ATCC 12856]